MRAGKKLGLFMSLAASCVVMAAGCGEEEGFDVESSKDAYVENCTSTAEGSAAPEDVTTACEAGAEAIVPCLEDNPDLSQQEVATECDPVAKEAVDARLAELGYKVR
jgi:hypothetical protein